jgi:hypothetical protein
MIVRGQHWLLIPAGQVIKLSREAYPAPKVCAQLNSSVDYYNDNILITMLLCKVKHINKDEYPCSWCTGLKQCQYCPMEFQIGVKVFEGRGIALVITKWLAVGSGMSPSDPKWCSHLHDEDNQPILQPFSFQAGVFRKPSSWKQSLISSLR